MNRDVDESDEISIVEALSLDVTSDVTVFETVVGISLVVLCDVIMLVTVDVRDVVVGNGSIHFTEIVPLSPTLKVTIGPLITIQYNKYYVFM